MSHYKHLTPEEREKILFFIAQSKSIAYIAGELGRSKSTISRELSRNSVNGEYSAVTADGLYRERRSSWKRGWLI